MAVRLDSTPMATYCCSAWASYASSAGRLNLNVHLMRDTSAASVLPYMAWRKSLHLLTKPFLCCARKASHRFDSPRSLYLMATPLALAAKLSSLRSGICEIVCSSEVRSSTSTCTEDSSKVLTR